MVDFIKKNGKVLVFHVFAFSMEIEPDIWNV